MNQIQKYAEALIFALILYSVTIYFVELEVRVGAERATGFFLWSERVITFVFTVEYLMRWAAARSLAYPLRPMAIIDLLAILPFYLGFLVDLRGMRLVRGLRVFRLFKLYRYTDALQTIVNAFFRVRYEFAVLGFAVLTLAVVSSVAVHELEKEAQPESFGRFSDAAWYTLTTLTTVGYGDKVPITSAGRLVASLLMIGGLGMFGTFVSLVGGAFVEELRVAIAQRSRTENADGAAPGSIDPREVLTAIEAGNFEAVERHPETVRLLAAACRQLSDPRRAPR